MNINPRKSELTNVFIRSGTTWGTVGRTGRTGRINGTTA